MLNSAKEQGEAITLEAAGCGTIVVSVAVREAMAARAFFHRARTVTTHTADEIDALWECMGAEKRAPYYETAEGILLELAFNLPPGTVITV